MALTDYLNLCGNILITCFLEILGLLLATKLAVVTFPKTTTTLNLQKNPNYKPISLSLFLDENETAGGVAVRKKESISNFYPAKKEVKNNRTFIHHFSVFCQVSNKRLVF
jgi:hypothetical protein